MLLLMVAEPVQLGYQRLRLEPGLCLWECDVLTLWVCLTTQIYVHTPRRTPGE
jgi:hypothetical protein